MDLKQQLDQDMKLAMKNKEKLKLSVIRMVRSSIEKIEIDKKRELSNEETLDVIIKEIKQRRDSLAEFEKGNREDLAEKEKEELEILTNHLPQQLSEEDLWSIIVEEIERLRAISKSDTGKVMGAVVPRIKGRADSKLAQQMVQGLLK